MNPTDDRHDRPPVARGPSGSTGRWLLLIGLALLVPIVPFVLLGERLESWGAALIQHPPGATSSALLVIGLLSSDVLLPIPSSLISTLAGAHLGPWPAVLASWLGLNLGAALGFAAARRWGYPLAVRLARADDLTRLATYPPRHAAWLLVATRALPILAEAAVILLGLQRLDWHRFLPPVVFSNLGIAVAYSFLGGVAADHAWLPAALGAATALPLLLTLAIKRGAWGARSSDT